MRELREPVNITEEYLFGINERLDVLIKLLQEQKEEIKKEEEVLIASVEKENAQLKKTRAKKVK